MKAKAKQTDDKLLTVAEVSELIGFGESTIYQGDCETDKLTRYEFKTKGRKRVNLRFKLSDVLKWIEAHKVTDEIPAPKPKPDKALMDAAIGQHQLRLVK